MQLRHDGGSMKLHEDRERPCGVQRAMQGARRGVLAAAALAALALPGAAGGAGGSGGAAFDAPFVRMPLDPPIVLTGNFGESRSGRYHGGLDFSTGGVVGREVFAPLAGWIERVRASGSGFGRALYLHADDGRLIVFAHLDAFDEPLASFVNDAQVRSGEYEQDLWPGRDRFRVSAGQRLAWSGESGAGPPHLHLEVRRGDVAYNPLRAGMSVEDRDAPSLTRLTLEPLDPSSFVQRSPAPWTARLDATPDTIVVEGRVRAVVEARDGAGGSGPRLAPWASGVTFGPLAVACQFDSARWGGDMADADYVYDHGRAGPGNGMVLWHAGGFRPTVIVGADGPPDAALEVRPGDPARALDVHVVDVAGGRAVRTVWLRGPRGGETGPDTMRTGPASRGAAAPFTLRVLPGRFARVSSHDAPAGSRAVTVCGAPAVYEDGAWIAIVPFDAILEPRKGSSLGMARLHAAGVDAAGRPWTREERRQAATDDGPRWSFGPAAPFEWWLAPDAVYEPVLLLQAPAGAPPGTSELVPLGDAWSLGPQDLALRDDVELRLALPEGGEARRVDVYRDAGRGWTSMGATYDVAGRYFETGTRTLGTFALMADTLAPRIVRRTPYAGARRPYSRWALEAIVHENGSGVDRRASWFEVDGVRVPTEYDAERRRLRWRPLERPAAGRHAYEVQATDAAGNVRQERGTFVIR